MNRWLKPLSLALLLIVAIAAGTGAFSSSEVPRPKPITSDVDLADDKKAIAPAPGSARDAQVADLINQTIDSSDFTAARWGVCVLSLKDGRILYARNANELFTPASNMKIYTTAVALELLGASYRWRTSVYAEAPPDAEGTIKGDLTLYGRGAPDLTSRSHKDAPASLGQLADDLYQRGVRHVSGNVIGDESYFRGEPLGDGWQWNDIQWYFGAEPSALSIDDNEVDVEIKPATVAGEPPIAKLSRDQSDLQLTSEIATVKSGERLTMGIHRGLSDNKVHVWGEFPDGSKGFGARLSVHDPARLAAGLFMAALKARGITIDGETRTRNFRVPRSQRFDPSRATELAFVTSRELSEVVRTTNKESVNLNAELILRTLGREVGELAREGDSNKAHERTDDVAGLEVIRLWLARAGIETRNLALHDGSGLSRLNLVTPEATARLLRATSQSATAAIFRDSLPVAGADGTLRGRLRPYKDRVFAKTGSLTYDNSLSGFLITPDGSDLAFSIMCNDQTGRASSTRLIDKIVELLAEPYAGKIPDSNKN